MEPAVTQALVEKKSPLESRTVMVNAVTLLSLVIGKFYAPLGDWIAMNSDAVIGLVTVLSMAGRKDADKALNIKDWTIKGFGIKF